MPLAVGEVRAMKRDQGESVLEGVAKLFDDRVGQDFACHLLDFGLSFILRESAVQADLEILALANVVQTLVAHFVESALNGLALGIQNALLEGDVNVGLHPNVIIR